MSVDRPQLKEVTTGITASLAEHARRPATNVNAPANEVVSGEALKDLERIREILYGSEKRDTGRRLEQMEQKLESFAVRVDTEIQRRMEAFEEQIKAEVRGLAAEIRTEQERRGQVLEAALRDFRNAIQEMEQKIDGMAARASSNERELRDLVGLQVQSLTELMRLNHDEVTAALSRTTRELRAETVDWPGLANALREVAKQVSSRRPGQDGSPIETE